MKRNRLGKIYGAVVLGGFVALLIYAITSGPQRPHTGRMKIAGEQLKIRHERRQREQDEALIRALMSEDLVERRFDFSTVMKASSGKRVIALDESDPVHELLLETIERAMSELTETMSQPDSLAHQHSRINEVSRIFEDGLMAKIDAHPAFECGVPKDRDGKEARVGYPDLRVRHQASETVFYLDPKLVRHDLWGSYFRSFYFEPKHEGLKVGDDAVHLLVGIGHDGNTGEWGFSEWKVVDLSRCQLRLKPEFQAANRDLYPVDDKDGD